MMLSFSRFEAREAAPSLYGEVCSLGRPAWSYAEGLGDAFLDEAKQFGFYIVAGELERELPRGLTVGRLREDLVEGCLMASGIAFWRADQFLRRSIGREQRLLPYPR
jgi:hypothetical protein